jgi:hypothetical protein
MTYYRISPRPLTSDDCHREHTSQVWIGDEESRSGLSCCASLSDLRDYFFGGDGVSYGRGAHLGGSYLVAFEGELSDDAPRDEGECLVHPTKIISCTPVEGTSWLEDLLEDLSSIDLTPSGRYEASKAVLQDGVLVLLGLLKVDGLTREDAREMLLDEDTYEQECGQDILDAPEVWEVTNY